MGFLHKRILLCCHPALVEALPYLQAISGRLQYHNKILDDHRELVIRQQALHSRSLYKYISIYNVLPQALIDTPSVPMFQAKLTQLTKIRAQSGDETWRQALDSVSDTVDWLYPDPPPID